MFDEELVITAEESDFLFCSTLLQSQSLLWFEHRRGRLTASKFGAICHTSVYKPSKSLVQEILQMCVVPKTEAMKWGIEHERIAMDAYVQCISDEHESFEINPAGLYINPLAPHLGASPDGLISCDCCGLGIL